MMGVLPLERYPTGLTATRGLGREGMQGKHSVLRSREAVAMLLEETYPLWDVVGMTPASITPPGRRTVPCIMVMSQIRATRHVATLWRTA
jgi:hypothetical protein